LPRRALAGVLQVQPGMVVIVIMLGTATKLAVAVGLTHRTRTWWMPGSAAMAGGAASMFVPILPRTVGAAALGLGAVALVVARSLHVPSGGAAA
jgi:urea transporter